MESKETLLAQLSTYSVIRLRRELSERGLQVSGMKADLRHRLEICIKSEIEQKLRNDMVNPYRTNENVEINLSDEYVVLDAVEESCEGDSTKPSDIEVSNISKDLVSDIDNRGNAHKRKNPKDADERTDHKLDRIKKQCPAKALPSNESKPVERRPLGDWEKEHLMEVESCSGKEPTQQIKPHDDELVQTHHVHKSSTLNRKKMTYKDLKSSSGPSRIKQDEMASNQPPQKEKVVQTEKLTKTHARDNTAPKPNNLESDGVVEEKVSKSELVQTKLTDDTRIETLVRKQNKSFDEEGSVVDQCQELSDQAGKSTKRSEMEENKVAQVGKSIGNAEYEQTKTSGRHQDGVVSKQTVKKVSPYIPIDRGFFKRKKVDEKKELIDQPKISSLAQEKSLNMDGNATEVSFQKMQDEKLMKQEEVNADKITPIVKSLNSFVTEERISSPTKNGKSSDNIERMERVSAREQGGGLMEDDPGEKVDGDQASSSMSLSPHSTDEIPFLTLVNDEEDIPTLSKDEIPLLTLVDDHAQQTSSTIKAHAEVKSDSTRLNEGNCPADTPPLDEISNKITSSGDEKQSLNANKDQLLGNDNVSNGEKEMPYFVDVILKERSEETMKHLDEEISLHTNKPHSGRTDVVTFWCELCVTKLANPTIAMQHLQGRPHRIKLKLKSCNEDLQNEKANISKNLAMDADKETSKLCTSDEDKMKCEDCGIVFETPFKAKWHFEGKKHAEVIAAKLTASLSSGIFSSLLSSSCSDSGSTRSNATGKESSGTTELKGILRRDKVSSRIHTLPTIEQMTPPESNAPGKILEEIRKPTDKNKIDTYSHKQYPGQYPDRIHSGLNSNISGPNNDDHRSYDNFNNRTNCRNDDSHYDSYGRYYETNNSSSSTSINYRDVPRPQSNLYSCVGNEMRNYDRLEQFGNRIDQSNTFNIRRTQDPMKRVEEAQPLSEDLYDPFQLSDDDDSNGMDDVPSPSLPSSRKKKPIVSYVIGSAGKIDAQNKPSSNYSTHNVVTYPEDCVRQPDVPGQESHDVNNNSGIDQRVINRGLNFVTKSENEGRMARNFPSQSVADNMESECRDTVCPGNFSSYSESEGYKQKSQYLDNCQQPYDDMSTTGSTKGLKSMECRDFSGEDYGMKNERSSLSGKTTPSDYRADNGDDRRNYAYDRTDQLLNDRGQPALYNLQRSQNQQSYSSDVITTDYSRCSYTYPHGPSHRMNQNR